MNYICNFFIPIIIHIVPLMFLQNAPHHSRNSSNHASTKGLNGRNNLMNLSKKSTASSNQPLGSDLSLLHDDYSVRFLSA